MKRNNTPLARLRAALSRSVSNSQHRYPNPLPSRPLPTAALTNKPTAKHNDEEIEGIITREDISNHYSELKITFKDFPSNLRLLQLESLFLLFKDKSLILLAPTGYGKTLVYILHGLILNKVDGSTQITIVISPITALTQSTVSKLISFGIKAYHCKGDPVKLSEFVSEVNCEACFIFLTPEVLKSKKVAAVLLDYNPSLLVVDEGHLVSEWGNNFRTDYQCIYEFAFLSKCSVAVFTATLPLHMLEEVKRRVGLPSDVQVIAVSPDRPNLYFDLRKSSTKLDNLSFLLDNLKDKKAKSDKTLIFVPDIPTASKIFLWFQEKIGLEGTLHYENDKPIGYIVNMYSACTDEDTKCQVIANFCDENGFLRILISTVAFGFGVDVPNIATTVIFGLPSSLITLVQEAGRTSRNIEWGKVIIFPYKSVILRKVLERFEIPISCCVREFLMSYFYTNNTAKGTDDINLNDLYCKSCCCCSYDRNICKCLNVPRELI